MTNQEKASELLQLSEFPNNKNQCDAVFELLMQMAQWKDEQVYNTLKDKVIISKDEYNELLSIKFNVQSLKEMTKL